MPTSEKQTNTAAKTNPEGEKVALGAIEEIQTTTVLKSNYDNIIIRNITSSSQIRTDYPKSAQEILSTSNNAWAASYNGGSSDTSLPADFGTLIGEYLFKLIPAGKG